MLLCGRASVPVLRMSAITFRDAVAERFKAQPNTWISAYVLMQVGGALAFRTRVSECRTQLGMIVENKVVRDENGVATSFYRYVEPAKSLIELMERAS